jgi:hypothetical protein
MNVPLLNFTAQYAAIKTEIRTAIDEVCETQYFILDACFKSVILFT